MPGDGNVELSCHSRVQAVGADEQICADRGRRTIGRAEIHATHASVGVGLDAHQPRVVVHCGARVDRGIDQDRIEQRPARRGEPGDRVVAGNVDLDTPGRHNGTPSS